MGTNDDLVVSLKVGIHRNPNNLQRFGTFVPTYEILTK
jgi:hypothetical protein